MDSLASASGYRLLGSWRRGMYETTRQLKAAFPDSYRDEAVPAGLVEEAYGEFGQVQAN